jgi:two-component system, chemotaxis family, response regulator Rcp1
MYAWEILAALRHLSTGHLQAGAPLPVHTDPDRRKERRYVVSETASITVSQPAEFLPIEGQLADVSRSGLRIRTPRAIHRGAQLHVQLKNIVVFGKARYCRPGAENEFDVGVAIDQVVIAQGARDYNASRPAAAPADLEVLLVEDNPGDVRLAELMLASTGIPHKLTVVTDGEQALKHLFHSGQPKPGLMLLDLNLPKVGGLRVLECLRQDREFDSVPVAILSSSAADKEIRRSQELGVLAYFQKPMDYANMRDLSTRVGALMSQLTH